MANRALYIAATGGIADSFKIATISNNLANLKTPSYKKESAETSDVFYQHFARPGVSGSGTVLPFGTYVGTGSKVQGVSRLNTEGSLYETNQELNIAIQGEGYFQIQMPDGSDPEIAYTRAGNFTRNDQGQIVTPQGYTVLPVTTIPQDAREIIIDANGTISAILPNVIQPQVLSQLTMANFINKNGLTLLGGNLYGESEASGPPIDGIATQDGFGNLLQRWLESSNVEPTVEMTELIMAHRSYEMNMKIIQVSDEMLQALNQAKK